MPSALITLVGCRRLEALWLPPAFYWTCFYSIYAQFSLSLRVLWRPHTTTFVALLFYPLTPSLFPLLLLPPSLNLSLVSPLSLSLSLSLSLFLCLSHLSPFLS